MSAVISIQSRGFGSITRKLLQAEDPDFESELLESIGALVESQTRDRLQEGKTSPDGLDWPDWSPKYAKSRHGGHSLLQGEGDLLDSIQYQVSEKEVAVGSNLIYAATHQFGDLERGIEAREFLGLSEGDLIEVDELLRDFAEGLLS